MNIRELLAAGLLVGIALTLSAQQPVAPAAKAGDNAPSLATTMHFIQDKLNGIGKASYSTQTANGRWQFYTNEISNVAADQDQCNIFYHLKETLGGKAYKDENKVLSLKDNQQIVWKPFFQYLTELDAKAGRPYIRPNTSTATLFVVVLQRQQGEDDFFLFKDYDLPERVSNALTHAAKLCGGGNKDPF